MTPSINPVGDQNISQVIEFLDNHIETSMFLASNLETYGPNLGKSPNSANFQCISNREEIVGVFCLTRRGILLAETGGETIHANQILEHCQQEDIFIEGVVGEWKIAESIWSLYTTSPKIRESLRSKETLYHLKLSKESPKPPQETQSRLLKASDFDSWIPLNRAYMQEEGFPQNLTLEKQRALFSETAEQLRWWGLFGDSQLISIASLNAIYQTIGQIGGVFTRPNLRRKGHARTVLEKLISDSLEIHQLKKIILFTSEKNVAAKRLYESLGFKQIGDFAIFFCKQIKPQQ